MNELSYSAVKYEQTKGKGVKGSERATDSWHVFFVYLYLLK